MHHPPIVRLIAGETDLSRVLEGSSVSFKCQVSARPPPHDVWWVKLEEGGKKEKVVGRSRTLHLPSAKPSDSGDYTCKAASSEGEGSAVRPLHLLVHFRPLCTSPLTRPHPQDPGGQPGVDLSCGVEARPEARSFRWLYNSTEGSFQIPSAKSMMSFMNYAVANSTETGAGQVLCWASNSVGEQEDPCIFRVVPLGAPRTPQKCKVVEKTQTSVLIGCREGIAASLDTTFVLEVFHVVNGSQELVASNWSRTAEVRAVGLSPNTSYILAVHATNDKGRSASVYIGGHTEGWGPPMPATDEDRLPVLYIIVAVLLSIMFLSLVLSITAACRRRMLFSKEKNMVISVAPLERGEEGLEEEEYMRKGKGEVGEDYQMPLIPHTSTPNSNSNGLHRKVGAKKNIKDKKNPMQLQMSIPSINGLQRKVSFRECTCASR